MEFLLVGIGGFFGAVARFSVYQGLGRQVEGAFPWGTTLVNVTGSLALGFLVSKGGQGLGQEVGLLLGTGFLGAYTTFSTFGWESVKLIENGELAQAAKFMLTNVVPGLAAAWLGLWLGSK